MPVFGKDVAEYESAVMCEGRSSEGSNGTAASERLKRWERENGQYGEFVSLLTNAIGATRLVEGAVEFFQRHAGCAIVQIRLQRRPDKPYIATSSVVEAKPLSDDLPCNKDCFEAAASGAAGLEQLCSCGVLCGQVRISESSFTADGSYWSGYVSRHEKIAKEPNAPSPVPQCRMEGMESVALIPLKLRERRIGLLRLADPRPELFAAEDIAFWETLTGLLALALSRFDAEQGLADREAQSRALFSTISDAIVVNEFTADQQVGSFVEVNDAFCRMLGYSREELLAMTPPELDDPASGFTAADAARQIREKGETTFDQVLIARDGTKVPVKLHACLLTLHGRDLVIASLADMTERKRTELDLRTNRQQLHAALDAARLGVWSRELKSPVITCDELTRSIFGWSPGQQVTISDLRERIVPEDQERFARERDQLISSNEDTGGEITYRIRRPDDEMRWVTVRRSLLRESAGEPKMIIGIVRDITRQKEAEIELSESRQQLRTSLHAAKLGVWNRDLKTNVITGDALTHALFDWREGEVVTTESLLERIVPEDRAPLLATHAMSDQAGSGIAAEYRVRLSDGGVRWLAITGDRVRDGSGEAIRMVGVVQDITERKRAEQHLRELEQQILHSQKLEAVGRLAGGIAHDFNNLLMVIRSYAEILEDSLPAFDPQRKSTNAIMTAADRAARLTTQMLAFSRKQVLSPVRLKLSATVQESSKLLKPLLGEDIELRLLADEPGWTVCADPDQISQVLMNLCVNARDAMPEGGSVTLATRNFSTGEAFLAEHPYVPAGDYALLTVTDTGVGIPKPVQERMFEPFFTTKSIGKGTGLGLSTVYGIIKQSGGYLMAESEPGQGASFHIYLPRVHGESDAPLTHGRLHRGSETLLIVEDEEALRASICESLRNLGYNVLSAESGEQALIIAREYRGRIDLVITDLMMPHMNGRELAQKLTEQEPALRIMYMSGYFEDSEMRKGMQHSRVLQKPFGLAALAKKIREVLSQQPD